MRSREFKERLEMLLRRQKFENMCTLHTAKHGESGACRLPFETREESEKSILLLIAECDVG